MTKLTSLVLQTAQQHALAVYPERSFGLMVKGEYIALKNVAPDPEHHRLETCGCRLCGFQAEEKIFRAYEADIELFICSAPRGFFGPSKVEMERQALTAKPWVIVPIDAAGKLRDPVVIGGEIQPLLGRKFIHGVADCYALIRDAFALGRKELAKQGIEGWPFDPVFLPYFPRNEGWWLHGENMYIDNFANAGFSVITDEPCPGDMFVSDIGDRHNVHGGIMVGNGMIAHHLPGRMSRLEPARLWVKKANVWVRQIGKSFDDAAPRSAEDAWNFICRDSK